MHFLKSVSIGPRTNNQLCAVWISKKKCYFETPFCVTAHPPFRKRWKRSVSQPEACWRWRISRNSSSGWLVPNFSFWYWTEATNKKTYFFKVPIDQELDMADQRLSCRETTGLQVYRLGRANLAESVRARVGEEAGWRVARWGEVTTCGCCTAWRPPVPKCHGLPHCHIAATLD